MPPKLPFSKKTGSSLAKIAADSLQKVQPLSTAPHSVFQTTKDHSTQNPFVPAPLYAAELKDLKAKNQQHRDEKEYERLKKDADAREAIYEAARSAFTTEVAERQNALVEGILGSAQHSIQQGGASSHHQTPGSPGSLGNGGMMPSQDPSPSNSSVSAKGHIERMRVLDAEKEATKLLRKEWENKQKEGAEFAHNGLVVLNGTMNKWALQKAFEKSCHSTEISSGSNLHGDSKSGAPGSAKRSSSSGNHGRGGGGRR